MAWRAPTVSWRGIVLLAVGCGVGAIEAPSSPSPEPERARPADDPSPSTEPASRATTLEMTPPPEASPPPLAEEPIFTRVSSRALAVFDRAAHGSEIRGAIPPRAPFYVYAIVDGEGCPGEGWARVSPDGYACLRWASETEVEPVALPVVPDGKLVPYIYARPRKPKGDDAAPEVHRWRSRHAFNRGDPPRETLSLDASYAFVKRRGNGRSGPVYIDRKRGAVPAKPMRRYGPSEFGGRDLVSHPLPAGQTVAWTRRRETWILAKPDAHSPVVSRPKYHAQLQVRTEVIHTRGSEWLEVVDAGRGASGYIESSTVRRWSAPQPEPSVGEDELWIDVDLERQTLSIMRGVRPVFATLVSTGKAGDATPTGVFRIAHKRGLDDMQSAEGADDPYYVEAVPWAQYFYRDFALHTAYWHDLFGNRTSHGCVNLSPRDGALLYSLTTPTPPPGWISVRETARDPGTVIRVRKGPSPVTDRRAPFPTSAIDR